MVKKHAKKRNVRSRVAKRNLKSTLNEGIFSKAKDKVKGLFKKKQKEEPKKLENVTPDEFSDLVSKLKPMSAVKYVAGLKKQQSYEYFIKNLPKILFATFKKMGSNIANFGKDIINMAQKTDTDKTSKKEFSDLDIDPNSATMKCMFDGEQGKQIIDMFGGLSDQIAEEEEEVKQEVVKLAQEEIKKKTGVKVDEKVVQDDPVVAVTVAQIQSGEDVGGKQDQEQSKEDSKSSDEKPSADRSIKSKKKTTAKRPKKITAKSLTNDIKKTTEQLKIIEKEVKSAKKKADAYKKSPIGRKTESDRRKLKTRLNKIISNDYKKSYMVGVYNTANLKKTQLKSEQFNTVKDKLSTKYTVAFILQYQAKKTDAILKSLGEAKNEKPAEVWGTLNPVSPTETKGIGKVSKEIEKVIKDYFKQSITGKVYTFRRSNKDSFNNTVDSILYIFASLKDYDKDLPSESEELVDEGFGGSGTVLAKLANTVAGLFGKKMVTVTTTKETAKLVLDSAVKQFQDAAGGDVRVGHLTTNISKDDFEFFINGYANKLDRIGGYDEENPLTDFRIHAYDKYYDISRGPGYFEDNTLIAQKYANVYLDRENGEKLANAIQNNGETVTNTSTEDVGDYSSSVWILPIIVGLKILNKEKKNIVNFFGRQAIRFKEDVAAKNIAVVNFYADRSKYSLRYSLKTNEWVLTKLDNRKAKIEEDFKENVLNSKFIQRFKKHCLRLWTPLFKAKKNGAITSFQTFIATYPQLGFKKKDVEIVEEMNTKFKQIEKDFE